MTTGDLNGLSDGIYSVFGVHVSDICGSSRSNNIKYARRVYVYILMNDFDISVDGVASLIRRDKTSIYWYVNNMDGWLKWDKAFKELLKSVKEFAGVNNN